MPKEVTKAEIVAFGRVLELLGKKVQDNPSVILNLLKVDEIKQINQEKDFTQVDSLSLLEFGKDKPQFELRAKLEEFDTDELRYLIQKYHLGSAKTSKIKTKGKLVDYIVDNIKNRTVDVFLDVGVTK